MLLVHFAGDPDLGALHPEIIGHRPIESVETGVQGEPRLLRSGPLVAALAAHLRR